jgi:hypothetical protein
VHAYKTADPTPEDKPIHAWSTGLGVIKKAISSFMPNKNVKWNVESQTGNPTMSVAVNDLIKKIKKAEVRKQAGEEVQCQARSQEARVQEDSETAGGNAWTAHQSQNSHPDEAAIPHHWKSR